MGASSIKSLPEDILDQLHALLRDPRVTQLDATVRINAILAEQGEKPVSKSAINRYAIKMETVGSKLQQSRQIADMWIGKLGNEPSGKVGQLLNEMVRNLAFESAMKLAEGEEIDPKLIKELAIAVDKLEKATATNEKTLRELEQRALAKATEKASEVATRNGLSAEMVEAFKREMLGVQNS